jgi:hypothetical protein
VLLNDNVPLAGPHIALPVRVAAKLAVTCIVVAAAVNTAAGLLGEVWAAIAIVQKPPPIVTAHDVAIATIAVPLPEPLALHVDVRVHEIAAAVNTTFVGHPPTSLTVTVSVSEPVAGLVVVAVAVEVAHVTTNVP